MMWGMGDEELPITDQHYVNITHYSCLTHCKMSLREWTRLLSAGSRVTSTVGEVANLALRELEDTDVCEPYSRNE